MMQWILSLLFFFLVVGPTYSLENNNIKEDLFCSAQTHQQMEQYTQAIELYKQRIARKGDFQEIWLSKYMIGECYEKLSEWDEALYWYLEAYQDCPDYSEPLLKISMHYRLLGCNHLAYIFAKFGSHIPFSKNLTYFTSQPVESYQFDEELSIVAYYTQFKEDGYKAASDLILRRNVPPFTREQTHRNLLYYLEPLKAVSYQPIEIDLPFIREEIRYQPMNPSITKTSSGYNLICRAVNYTQEGAKHFHSYDEDGIYRSRNFLVQYDFDFHLLSQNEILDEFPRTRIGTPRVQGLEDCRIFEWNQRSWFTCTTTDTNPTGSFQISLCRLNDEIKEGSISLDQFVPLKGPDPYRCEKNWLPFVSQEKFCAIYQYDPFIIYAPNAMTGECECIHTYQPEYDFSSFRGSAGPIPFEDGHLVLVHEVAFLDGGKRAYMHRLILLDSGWMIKKISKPFVFRHIGVEYCCSMSWNHTGTQIIFPIGIEDREAFLCTVDFKTIQSMLDPLPMNP